MTETEKKALALVNDIEREEGLSDLTPKIMRGLIMDEALCRAIEQHEAFRQKVSDKVAIVAKLHPTAACYVQDLIIAKPDPLVEVIADYKRTKGTGEYATNKDMADALRAALAARGLEIKEKQP